MGARHIAYRSYKATATIAQYFAAYARIKLSRTPLSQEKIDTLQKKFSRRINQSIGTKVVFNGEALSALKENQNIVFLANHLSKLDPTALGEVLDTTFVGKEEVLAYPTVKTVTEAVHFVPVKRTPRAIPETRGRLIQQLNKGFNLALFPQATTSKKFNQFKHALLDIFYGKKKNTGPDNTQIAIDTNREILVHPVAIHVKDKDIDRYCEFFDNGITSAFNMIARPAVEVNVTVLPAINPKDFENSRDLANEVQKQIAQIVAPGQTDFTSANIKELMDKKKNGPKY